MAPISGPVGLLVILVTSGLCRTQTLTADTAQTQHDSDIKTDKDTYPSAAAIPAAEASDKSAYLEKSAYRRLFRLKRQQQNDPYFIPNSQYDTATQYSLTESISSANFVAFQPDADQAYGRNNAESTTDQSRSPQASDSSRNSYAAPSFPSQDRTNSQASQGSTGQDHNRSGSSGQDQNRSNVGQDSYRPESSDDRNQDQYGGQNGNAQNSYRTGTPSSSYGQDQSHTQDQSRINQHSSGDVATFSSTQSQATSRDRNGHSSSSGSSFAGSQPYGSSSSNQGSSDQARQESSASRSSSSPSNEQSYSPSSSQNSYSAGSSSFPANGQSSSRMSGGQGSTRPENQGTNSHNQDSSDQSISSYSSSSAHSPSNEESYRLNSGQNRQPGSSSNLSSNQNQDRMSARPSSPHQSSGDYDAPESRPDPSYSPCATFISADPEPSASNQQPAQLPPDAPLCNNAPRRLPTFVVRTEVPRAPVRAPVVARPQVVIQNAPAVRIQPRVVYQPPNVAVDVRYVRYSNSPVMVQSQPVVPLYAVNNCDYGNCVPVQAYLQQTVPQPCTMVLTAPRHFQTRQTLPLYCTEVSPAQSTTTVRIEVKTTTSGGRRVRDIRSLPTSLPDKDENIVVPAEAEETFFCDITLAELHQPGEPEVWQTARCQSDSTDYTQLSFDYMVHEADRGY